MTERFTLAVNELVDDAMRGRTSRRELVRRASALGISAAALPFILRARGVAAQDATPDAGAEAWGSTIVLPEGLRTDLAGATITTILDSDGPGKPFEEAAVAKFVEATGIQVNNVSAPTSTTDRLAQYQQFLGAQASDVDVMMIDVIHPGILAQHAIDLTAALESQGAEYFPRIVENNTVDGKLVGIPFFTDAGIFYYRTDLLQKYGIETPPATWAELETAAKTIMDGERASVPDFQGFVFQGNAYEGLTCDALEWQASHGGGEIIDADGTVTLNNPQTVAAFERAKSWVGVIAPQGVTTYDEEASRGVWQAGNAAFMRNWPYAYSLGQANDSAIKDKFDVSVLPMGEGEGARNAATLGGWQLMVSTYSKNQEAAVEFAKYITSKNLQKSYAIERSLNPTIAELYDDPDVLARNPFFAKLKDVFQGGAVARPSTPSGDLYGNVSTVYFTGVNQILTGQKDAASAVEEMTRGIEDVMSQL